jgi:hypothetical protein
MSKRMSLRVHRPQASWLSIVVVGYAMAAIMVVLLWAGLHAGFF